MLYILTQTKKKSATQRKNTIKWIQAKLEVLKEERVEEVLKT